MTRWPDNRIIFSSMKIACALGLAALCAAAVAAVPQAQQAAGALQLDVAVVDASGHPVPGLTADQFDVTISEIGRAHV